MIAKVFKCVFKCFRSMFQLPSDVCLTVGFICFKSRSGVASLLLPPSAASSLPEPAGHPYKRGMDDGRGTRELCTDGCCLQSGMGARRRGLRSRGWEQGCFTSCFSASYTYFEPGQHRLRSMHDWNHITNRSKFRINNRWRALTNWLMIGCRFREGAM